MKKLLTLTCLLAASVAYAQTPHYLDLFFSTNIDYPTGVPEVPTGPLALDCGTETWLALYGRTDGMWQQFTTTYKSGVSTKTWTYKNWVGDVWHGISCAWNDPCAMLDQNQSFMIEENATGGAAPGPRWQAESDYSFNKGQFNVAAVSGARGCGGAGLMPAGSADNVAHFDAAQYCDVSPNNLNTPGNLWTLLGYVYVVCPGGLCDCKFYFKVGTGTIARRDGTPNYDYVRFGTSTPVLAKTIFATGNQPMIVCIPEPASLLLLGLAGFALRRR